MHMRTKKWAKPELAVCPYFTDEAEKHRGHWRELFEKNQPLYLELGCGKGVSTAAMVYDNQDVNFIAMDITCNVLGDTRRNIAAAYGDEPVDNVIITRHDIEFIRNVFAPEDLPRIFENGFTGYNGRAHKKASGIGLYLCKRICTNLGHSITVESEVGKGTLITVDLARTKLGIE